jgi:cytoskeleton protein RodZ
LNEQPPNASAGEESEEPLAGKRLAEARRLRGISIVDIAKELHLDEPRVRALEQNRFDALGAPVFVKGYIRKYAEVVGVSSDEVLADYRSFERRDEAPPIVGLRKPPRPEISAGPWLGGVLLIAVVAGGAWAWLSGSLDPVFNPQEAPLLAPFEPEESSGDEVVARQEPAPASEEAAEVAGAPEPAAAGPAAADVVTESQEAPPVFEAPPAARPGEGQVGLTVAFSGDCWTEVSDAAGVRLYFGLGKAGETMSVVGTAPLHVLLGDSDNATVRVDGDELPIPRSARRGDTARLTITGR